MTLDELARAGYRAYREARHWLDGDCADMPLWEHLDAQTRSAWTIATASIVTFARDVSDDHRPQYCL